MPVLVLLVLAGLAAGGYELWQHEHKSSKTGGGGNPPPASAATVHLTAYTAYDPSPGNGHERNDLLSRATDGDPSTYWQTEHYTTAAFGNLKKGVGIVFDAGKDVRLGSLTVKTGTPGFSAEVEAGSSSQGPFSPVSKAQTVANPTTFTLNVPNAKRYYVIWITQLVRFDTGDPVHPYGAQIAEVTAS